MVALTAQFETLFKGCHAFPSDLQGQTICQEVDRPRGHPQRPGIPGGLHRFKTAVGLVGVLVHDEGVACREAPLADLSLSKNEKSLSLWRNILQRKSSVISLESMWCNEITVAGTFHVQSEGKKRNLSPNILTVLNRESVGR